MPCYNSIMNQAYQEPKNAQKYLDFLNSENGQIQQEILHDAIIARLPADKQIRILDAACGPGWLAKKLLGDYANVQGCDVSAVLIAHAKTNYPGIKFIVADMEQVLPYEDNFFDCVILNMAAPDLENLPAAFKNLSAKLKNSGQMLMTIPNPQLTYPAAVWKRGAWGWLMRKKPKLMLQKTKLTEKKIQREFNQGQSIDSHFYALDEYLAAAKTAGLILINQEKIKSEADDKKFNLRYQLYRYPLILFLEFTKPSRRHSEPRVHPNGEESLKLGLRSFTAV